MTDIVSQNTQKITNKPELLAPAGNMEKLKTAFHFGADAVYLAGKRYGLRAFADNFTDEQITEACQFAHSLGKKVYVTINIFAKNSDFDDLANYLKVLENARVDAVLVSDLGVFDFVKTHSNLTIHVSTQANTTNGYAVAAWAKLGAERVVLAREVPLSDIEQIHKMNPSVELETFVHGAMCISYSGRCLLSSYLTDRDSNRGECVQACRWKWYVREVSRDDELEVTEDERGTYIFNSKDMNALSLLPRFMQIGVSSLKIEGRMKSVFYVATVVSAYRKAIDAIALGCFTEELQAELQKELSKASHRKYTTGFYDLSAPQSTRQYYEDSKAVEEYKFIAVVKQKLSGGKYLIEQRNKFVLGDELEVLSAANGTGKSFVVNSVTNQNGQAVEVCNKVKELLVIDCPYDLLVGDILRKPQ